MAPCIRMFTCKLKFSYDKSLKSVSRTVVIIRNISIENKLFAMPVIAPDNVYLDKPKYPAIRDPSKFAKVQYKRLDWYEQIKEMPTVAEKALAISTPKRQYTYVLQGLLNTYGANEFAQHITKTHLVKGMPEKYDLVDVRPFVSRVRDAVLDAVVCENVKNKWSYPKWKDQDCYEDPSPVVPLAETVLYHLTSAFSSEFEHLFNTQVTEAAVCEAFWWRGNDQTDLTKNFPSMSWKTLPSFQLVWRPDFQIRTQNPLPPVLDRDDPFCASSDVPYCPYHPKFYMDRKIERFLTCMPGFWPGDACEFPFLSVVSSHELLKNWREKFGENDVHDSLDQAAMVCSFGWLQSSALMQGFTPYNELTYPFVGQTIYTDGKTWTFYVYQLNTIALHPDLDKKTHRNICWTSGPMDLYEAIEDGQLKGVNEELLQLLVKFFLMSPEAMPEINLKPYLNEASVTAEFREEKLQEMIFQFANRPDHSKHLVEIPTWHHVYLRNPKAPLSPRVKLR